MIRFFNSNIGRLRLIGLLEGISLLVLVGVAMPLKYVYHDPTWTKNLGPIHGALFLLFVFQTLGAAVEYRWAFKTTTWKVLLACMVPFGTFYVDRAILSKMPASETAD